MVRRVFLTGPMASGKSTVGRSLAKALDWPFHDMDALIEEKIGMSIPKIFERHGEAFFREKERDVLHQMADFNPAIIATGGGALVQDGAMSWAQDHGLVIYLQVDEAELARRLSGETDSRPLLSDEDAVSEMLAILKSRAPIYKQADLVMDANHDIETLAHEIEQIIHERLSLNE